MTLRFIERVSTPFQNIFEQRPDFISEFYLSKKSVTSFVTHCSARNRNGNIYGCGFSEEVRAGFKSLRS
jgi:hypothetical protein